MKFLSFFVARILKMLLVVLGVVIINFFLIRLAPGDPAAVLAGQAGSSDPAYLEQLRAAFGLDKPLLTQLWIYIKDVAHLNLGYSYRSGEPVLKLIMQRLPATFLLMASAFVFSIILGIIFGVVAARARVTRKGWLDNTVTTTALVLYATPLFWLSLMGILLFSVVLGWLPAFGMESVGSRLTGLARARDIGYHLILPTITLGCFFMAFYVRLTRASMLEVINMDFVKTARAKGLPSGLITRRHVLRNALLPVITFAGIQLGQMAGGAVLTETVFAWPGIGRLMFDALLQRDYQLLLGIFLITSTMVVVFNFITEIIYRIVDPRIAAGAQEGGA